MYLKAIQETVNIPDEAITGSDQRPSSRLPYYSSIPAFLATHQPEAPVITFSERRLRNNANQFLAGFPGLTTYALKANPQREVIETLIAAGVTTFDVASLNEIATVRHYAPDAVCHYNNPIKSRTEIKQAYTTYGIRSFAADDENELQKIIDVIGKDDTVEIFVRIANVSTTSTYDFSTKFGAQGQQACNLMRAVHASGYRLSITFHPGSQCPHAETFAEHIRAAAALSRTTGLWPERLDVGGGFPAAYLNHTTDPLEDFFAVIKATAATEYEGHMPALICEPGRAMVANTASLITRIKHKRPDGTLFLNDGIYGALMEMNMMPMALPLRVWKQDGEKPAQENYQAGVFGPTCDSIDALPETLALPVDIAEGDWLEFGLVGAYGTATMTAFNGYGQYIFIKSDDIA